MPEKSLLNQWRHNIIPMKIKGKMLIDFNKNNINPKITKSVSQGIRLLLFYIVRFFSIEKDRCLSII